MFIKISLIKIRLQIEFCFVSTLIYNIIFPDRCQALFEVFLPLSKLIQYLVDFGK